MKPECRSTRETRIDEAVGQADAADLRAAHAHAARCEECRREGAELARTIERLRRHAALLPSLRAQERLRAALDQVDAARRPRRGERVLDGARFRLLLLGHQLRHSRKWQLRVAAACLPLLAGLGLLARERLARRDPGPLAHAPPPEAERAASDDPSRTAGPEVALAPALDEWRPTLDEPREQEPVRPGPVLEELDEATRRRAAEELVKLNRIEEQTLARLRAGEEAPRPPPAPPATEPAPPTRRALEWLARNQRADGSWTPGLGEPGLETGLTALVLLALVSDGHLGGPEAQGTLDLAVDRAAAWLFARQDAREARFVGGSDPSARAFSHAVACLALTERHVLALAAGRLDAETARRDHDRLERALTRLEIDLDLQLGGERDGRCAGQVAAWAALALTTARHGGVDFHLRATGEAVVASVLERLRADQPALMRAASQTICVMAGRDPPAAPPSDASWADAVSRVLEQPDRVEPSLRFLVASALHSAAAAPAPDGLPDGRRRDEWRRFQAALERRLLATQSAEGGYFDSGIRWDCFDGGTAGETALAVAALRVAARHEAWAAARGRLAPARPRPK